MKRQRSPTITPNPKTKNSIPNSAAMIEFCVYFLGDYLCRLCDAVNHWIIVIDDVVVTVCLCYAWVCLVCHACCADCYLE